MSDIFFLIILKYLILFSLFDCSQLFNSHLLSEERFIGEHSEHNSDEFVCCRKNRLFGRKPLLLSSEKILSESILTPDSADARLCEDMAKDKKLSKIIQRIDSHFKT